MFVNVVNVPLDTIGRHSWQALLDPLPLRRVVEMKCGASECRCSSPYACVLFYKQRVELFLRFQTFERLVLVCIDGDRCDYSLESA